MDFSLNLGALDGGKLVKIDENKLYDVTVVGSGPAAVSAAIYAARKGLNVAMVGVKIGGQVLDTNEIENIIGTVLTTGAKFAETLEKHLKEHEIAFKEGHLVKEIKEDGKDKILVTDDGKSYKTKTVIVATGAKPRSLNIPGEAEYVGKGVHYCSTCDGPFYKGLDVAVIGGGNSGVEAALDLSGIAKSVTLIEFMPELKADKVLQEKLAEQPNVKTILNSATVKVNGNEFVESIVYKSRETDEEKTLNVEGMFVEIGLSPRSEVVKDLVETNKIGEIVINPENNSTSVAGIFAAGDVTNIRQKQIIIAMGEGAKAALGAFEYLITKY
ncbi:FAD-dependent oxidoreductase [Leptotrichia hongkongensis]|jgi:alkyl hydroperoxide reductase, F subunit|uniref:FAD-dependent oxidoreductase n=1 Tax=Leptotrichia hongkongensis TaxID=554406 RepID=UPI002604F65D|nr:FAD-dependent oxidoreductase [uncultured Leptotrichia sp.]